MQNNYLEKIDDYLSGLAQIKTRNDFLIGSVIANEDIKGNLEDIFTKHAYSVIKANGHPDVVIKRIFNEITAGRNFCLNITDQEIDSELINLISNLSANQFNAIVNGKRESIGSVSSTGSNLVLWFTEDSYRNFILPSVLNSTCNLEK